MKTKEVLVEVLAGRRFRLSTRRSYEKAFRSLGAMYGEFPEKAVEINKWMASLERYSDYTVRTFFSIVRTAGEYMEANYDMVNACKGMKLPHVKKVRRRYHKADDIVRILQACRGDFEYALIMTLVDSSCRVGGLAGLKGSDVGQGFINVTEKTGERRYRLDERICEKLKLMAENDNALVFGGLGSEALSMRVIRISRRAGLSGKKLGAHTLRHSSASLVASETKNPLVVKALLQHDDIESSMGYIHDVEEEIQKRTSPLQIVADRVKDSGLFERKQITMVAGSGAVEGEIVVENRVSEVDSLMGDMFPEIRDGIKVHSALDSDDLRLIRKAFIALAGYGEFSREVGQGRLLMKRMLRKVK